jgi:integrase
MGLGSYANVGLDEARTLAAEVRAEVRQGKDPLMERSKQRAAIQAQTFEKSAEAFFEAYHHRWRNKHVRQKWLPFLYRHTHSLWKTPISEIGTVEILKVVEPLWRRPSPCVAQRIMGRMAMVFNFAIAREWFKGENPAQFKGKLEYLLPYRAPVAVKHHAAMPLSELPKLMRRLENTPGTAALAARFSILTTVRLGEIVGAKWEEFDLENGVWHVPQTRTKTARSHLVPLSSAALALLDQVPRTDRNPYVFISPLRPRTPISHMAIQALFKRMGVSTTLHGTSRSTFHDWASDYTDASRELIAECLGHKAQASEYRRGQAINKRRALLEAWSAELIERSPSGANIIKIEAKIPLSNFY